MGKHGPRPSPTARPLSRIPPAVIAPRPSSRGFTRPLQPPICKLDIIILMLTHNYNGMRQLREELEIIRHVDRSAVGLSAPGRDGADGGFAVVEERDGGEEILVIGGANLRFREVEGAGPGGVGWGGRRDRSGGRRGCLCGSRRRQQYRVSTGHGDCFRVGLGASGAGWPVPSRGRIAGAGVEGGVV